MSNVSLAGPNPSTAPAPPPGLINAAPDANPSATTPVTGYNPQQAQASTATTASATPKPFQVTPEQTVSGQIANIIAAGSPLMQQAETNAKNVMNQRGLINSSQAITAGQSALYSAAAPIASADAATYAKAATDTTTAQNAALTAEAAAKNTASGTNAQLGTAVSQSNAGATNTMLGNAQQISGSTNIAEIQSATSKAIADLQSNTTLTAQDKQNAGQQLIAAIQANTALSETDKQTMSAQVIAQMQASTTLQTSTAQIASAKDLATLQAQVQTSIAAIQANTSMSNQDKQDATSKILAGIQANTQLSVADKAAASQAVTTAANNASAQAIAKIQADTSLSLEEKQTLSAQIIAGMNNQNAQTVQGMVNEGNLATIKANGAINTDITNLTNTNKLLLQTSSAAGSIYAQVLNNMAGIMTNKDMTSDQKTSALNSSVAGLNDALKAISNIANNQGVNLTLNFQTGGDGNGPQNQPSETPPPAPTPVVTPPTPTPATETPANSTTTMQTAQGPVVSTPGLDALNASWAQSGITGPSDPRFGGFQQQILNQYQQITDPAVLKSQLAYQQSRVNDQTFGQSAAVAVQTLQAQLAKIGSPVTAQSTGAPPAAPAPPAVDLTPAPGYVNPRTGGNLSDQQMKAMGFTWPGMS